MLIYQQIYFIVVGKITINKDDLSTYTLIDLLLFFS
jgi:hypothetical protein